MLSMLNKVNSTPSLVSEAPPTVRCKCVFTVQVLAILIIIVFSLVNLSLSYNSTEGTKKDDKLWIVLLSSTIGYLLPNPKLKGALKVVSTSAGSSVVN